jgi:nucleotide-binding universal stress UspA family protein
VGVPARGVIRSARSGRVGDEIVYAAHKYHVSQIVMGGSRRSWLGRLFFGSVSPRVLRLSDLPVLIVRGPDRNDSRGPAPSGSPRGARGHARA